MIKLGLLLCATMFSNTLQAEERLLFSLDPGWSLYNSENSLKTMEEGSLGWTPGFSIGFETDSLWGLALRAEYAYARSVAIGAMQFIVTGPGGPQATGTYGADVIFTTHNMDVAVATRPVEYFSLAGGPTLSLAHRTIDLTTPRLDQTSQSRHFVDRVASLCAGLNASVNLEVPLGEGDQYFFFLSSLKLRYLYSLWFDKRDRNLDDYYQESILGQLSIGLGYSF